MTTFNGKRGLRNFSANPVALVIDMQPEFLKEVVEKKELIECQSQVLHYCRKNNIAAIAVEYTNNGRTVQPLRKHIAKVPKHAIITKSAPDGFSNSELEKILRGWGADMLLLMGVNASLCVKDTAQGAADAGFKFMTAGQLIADEIYFQKRNKELSWYRQNGLYLLDYRNLLKDEAQL